MASRILKNIIHYTGFDEPTISSFINKAPYSYKRFTIPKRSGGYRYISQPTRETKTLQYAIIDLVLSKLPIHEIAFAYQNIKSPILKNVSLHKNFAYSLRVDFKDFFPSIKSDDLIAVIQNYKTLDFDDEDYELIKKICFQYIDKEYSLSIGAPSSPSISNIVMYGIDSELKKISQSINKDSSITRYADDIVFSSNKSSDMTNFLKTSREFLRNISSPKLELNKKKTLFMTRANKRIITGLVVTPDKRVSIGRNRKRLIKSLVHRHLTSSVTPEELKSLRGYLHFVNDVEPNFYTSLVIKYTAEGIDSIYKEKT